MNDRVDECFKFVQKVIFARHRQCEHRTLMKRDKKFSMLDVIFFFDVIIAVKVDFEF